MGRLRSLWSSMLLMAILAVSCAAPAPNTRGGAGGGDAPGRPPAVKRLTLGMEFEPDIRPNAPGTARFVALLVHSGLTELGDQRIRRPLLAEAVPSLDNGLWKLLPDGRMETTWRLREGTRWHDGAPLTSDDLLFSLQVGRDRDMAGFGSEAYASIEEVRAPDPRTLTVTWKDPFVDADSLLAARLNLLIPRHLLEDAYRGDKASFLDLPYWTSEFVGAGAFRLREWSPGMGIALEANDQFVLGRPRVDEIEVRFIPDANTLSANLLAGTVDVTGNVGSIDLGVQLRDQWRDGTVVFNYAADNWAALYPQFIEPRPGAVGDVRFRRALAHAIDRPEIVDTLVAGLSPVPHTFLSPNQAAYRDIEATVLRYEYDPRKATQILETSGYRKGSDGTYRDEADRRLEIEVHSQPQEATFKLASATADYWQRLGIDATAVRMTPQQYQDPQYAATFPGFLVFVGPDDVNGLRFLYGSQARVPSNNFRVAGPGNRSRYVNPEFDARLDAYFKTVPVPQRIEALGQVIRHMADQVTAVGLYYNPIPGAISNRVANVSNDWPQVFITWNAHEWDLRG
jgi:peptide/nickel transport system substrate-binding protein